MTKLAIPTKIRIRKPKWPKIHILLPEALLPKLTLPKIKFPQFTLPRISVPKVNIPRPSLPKVSLPKLKLPAMRAFVLSKLSVPKIEVPKVLLPRLIVPSIPKIAFPHIRPPKVKIPELRVPKMPVILQARDLPTVAGILICLFVFTGLQTGFGQGVVAWASNLPKIELGVDQSFFKLVRNDSPQDLNSISPASGESEEDVKRYDIEENSIAVEAVLIPRENTVISSSQDGKIKALNFDNGETFKKGDILIEYGCKDLRAEVEIAKSQAEVTQKKSAASYKLFKLDIISDIEKLELESEQKQAEARTQLYESRMEDCYIRAEYDGRVVKRLANAGEFTRTDRVLMEVASLDYLKAEFLLPSRWLRWVNVGAPIEITLNETEKTYPATIKFIYGEVDPVSQSIQITAQLDPYVDPLLPGMSGQTVIDINAMREAGIFGFLEQKPQDYRP